MTRPLASALDEIQNIPRAREQQSFGSLPTTIALAGDAAWERGKVCRLDLGLRCAAVHRKVQF